MFKLNRFLIVKVLVDKFSYEKALEGSFSGHCETWRSSVDSCNEDHVEEAAAQRHVGGVEGP